MDDLYTEHVESADKTSLQDQMVYFEEIAEFVNTRVYELVTEKVNKDNIREIHKKYRMDAYDIMLSVDADTNEFNKRLQHRVLKMSIRHRYGVDNEVASAVAKETTDDVIKRYVPKKSLVQKKTPEEMKLFGEAFTNTKYIGNASFEFEKYVERCWRIHCTDPGVYKEPYVAVVQSSGFGKSRMLFELARMARKPDSKQKVFYVCARKNKSTGYPEATKKLRKWLFPSSCTEEIIATRLKAIFKHAFDNWGTVQDEWLKLFTSTAAETDLINKLENTEKEIPHEKLLTPVNSSSDKIVIVVIDEARSLLAEKKNSISHFRMLRHALQSNFSTEGGVFGVLVDTNSKISNLTPPLSCDPSSRRIDAKKLASFPPFVLTHTMDIFWQQYCGGEQADQVEMIRDTDKTVVDIADESMEAADEMADDEMLDVEETKRENVAVDTSKDSKKKMNADISAYKDAVTGSEQDAWNALLRMGRPLWYSTFMKVSQSQASVVNLAANKLLVGNVPATGNYKEVNMFGIASLLCRVGLRPYSTSLFASRAVSDFMAILAYVNYEKEGYVSSYASDPVLSLGARKVWYGQSDTLSQFILPQLKKLILNEALDTGAIGEVVARIVLLLAMDECVEGYSYYAGQFIAVHDFLKVLGAEEMPVFMRRMNTASDNTMNAFQTWRSKWKGWKMGFTHFVQLQLEPTAETLWYLLGRRAAGIFPRNQKGADLLIPVFWKKEDEVAAFESEMKSDDEMDVKVSLILIQVKNCSPHDSKFPMSATTKLYPSFVFGEKATKTTEKSASDPGNPLSKMSACDVICIYMNMQEEDNLHHRFIYANEFKDGNKSDDGSGAKLVDTLGKAKKCNSKEAAAELRFTFCYRSVRCDTYTFLDAKVAEGLKSLMETSWDPSALVDGDLKHRQEVEQSLKESKPTTYLSQAMGDKELRAIACKGLVDPPGRQRPSESASANKRKREEDA